MIDAINALSTVVTAVATLVLAIFAWVQLRQINEQNREQHRRKLRNAYGALYVELCRMRRVCENWDADDLISLAGAGMFNPDSFPPSDWGATMPLLGALGPQAAEHGGNAYSVAVDTVAYGRRIVALAEEKKLARLRPSVETAAAVLGMDHALEQAQTLTRSYAARAVDLFQDALASAPDWLRNEYALPANPKSALLAMLRYRQGEAAATE